MSQVSDEHILKMFHDEKSREKAFGLLMEKFQNDIYFSIRRVVFLHEDAKDVTQNVFIKIWRYLDSFRGDASLKTWITRICINEAISFMEKKRRLLNLSEEEYMEFMLQSIPEDRYFSADKIQQLIQQAIQSLPEKQRIVFCYRYYDEMPYEEMSKILHTSEGALKASYHFAVKKVEDFIREH